MFWTLVTIYFPYYPLFVLRSVLVQFSIGSRSVLVRFSIVLRSILVHPSFILRSFSVRESKIDRRTNWESSQARRRCIETLMGNQGKGTLNKKTPKIPHNPHASDFQKKTLKKLSTRKTLKINTLPKIAKKFFKKTLQNIWSLLKNAVPLHSQIRNNAYHANKIAKCKCLKMSCEIDLWQELHKTFVEKYKRQMSIQKNVRVKVTCQFQRIGKTESWAQTENKTKTLYYNEEFDPGSGWTLATGLTHASRGAACWLLATNDGDRRTGE